MAQNLAANEEFARIYPHEKIFYLTCGIMEVFDSGFQALSCDLPQSLAQDSPADESNPAKIAIQALKSRYLASRRAFVVAFSGGKDSTCVLQLFYEMLLSLPPDSRRQSYAIASNTLVEPPHIEDFLRRTIETINAHARTNQIPFEILQVSPSLKDDFWTNLIGRGYPSPTRTFRWCTDRLKIAPAKAAIAEITKKHGAALLILGTRKAESQNRKKSIEKRVLSESGYSQHEDFPDTMTYAPIAEWSTDEVWAYLSRAKPAWGGDFGELFRLYAKASGEECQFITNLAQNSCGGSRFGCWVCTVVAEDKSLQGFISNGEENLVPLNDFRNFLKNLREDSSARSDYKRDGRAVFKVGALGPFLSETRKEILRRLLKAEAAFKKSGGQNAPNLISDAQIRAIQEIWDRDFDLEKSAIKLAKEVGKEMGGMSEEKIQKTSVLHSEILDEVCEEGGFRAREVENLIGTCIEIYHNTGARGRDNAGQKIREEIRKILDDKTAKEAKKEPKNGGADVY